MSIEVIRGQTFAGDADPFVFEGDGERIFEDCTFTAPRSWTGVLVARNTAITLRNCRIESGFNRGLVVDGGRAEVEDCVFLGNKVAIWATLGAVVYLRRCRVEGPGSVGVFFQRGATGRVEDCSVSEVRDAAVVVRTDATPIIARCTISAGQIGALYEGGGAGELQACTITANVGLWVHATASPRVVDCEIEGAAQAASIQAGAALMERCRLRGLTGVLVRSGGDPTFLDCDVAATSVGVFAEGGARGRFQRCTIHGDTCATHLLPGADLDFDGGAGG